MDTEVNGKRPCQNCGTLVDVRFHCDGCEEELCEGCHNDHQNGCEECDSVPCGRCGKPVKQEGGVVIVEQVDPVGGQPEELGRFCNEECYKASMEFGNNPDDPLESIAEIPPPGHPENPRTSNAELAVWYTPDAIRQHLEDDEEFGPVLKDITDDLLSEFAENFIMNDAVLWGHFDEDVRGIVKDAAGAMKDRKAGCA